LAAPRFAPDDRAQQLAPARIARWIFVNAHDPIVTAVPMVIDGALTACERGDA